MKFTYKYYSLLVISCLVLVNTAGAAIQYGGETYQSSYAASTTNAVGGVVDDIISGGVTNPLSGSSTINTDSVVSGAVGFFGRVNNWLKEKAGIDFTAILKAVGHFFILTVQFVVELVKKLL